MQTDLIIIKEYCDKCHIDPSFIIMLEEDGLIDIQIIDQEKYLVASQLAELEKYSRMYYDLSINIAGIDAIHHLLHRMQMMQREIHHLKNELGIYRKERMDVMEEF